MGKKGVMRSIRESITQGWLRDSEEKNLPLTGHLEELRYRFIVVFVTIGGCFAALYPFSESLLTILIAPMQGVQLHMLAPAEAFIVHLKLSIFAAIVISIPMTFYQAWAFVAPGLYAREKKYVIPFVISATIFFGLGGYFAYKVMLPFGLKFLLGYGGAMIIPIISAANYVTFITRMILAFGAIFELPIIIVFLTKLGMVTPATLKVYRKYAIVGAFVVGAILTPPDVFSQILMAGPLIILYEMSIWVCHFLTKQNMEQTNDTTEETDN
ncbi:twin arginine-targeting protein translocase TatC [Candidatus Vecturithrix granuli]|uniref:Sec-independent protein translocase protein TatC n=1 Tax=Vecturithrix granuli TaxID=1499967 RepID=A0A0S6WBQ7_VECG1|nr:twin arginine-targeting protein translocase TatC [Candidatus Vecturithrix granuli]